MLKISKKMAALGAALGVVAWLQVLAKNPDYPKMEVFSNEWIAVIADVFATGFLVIISIVMGIVIARHVHAQPPSPE